MKNQSVFDPNFQNQSIEAKIVVGLERIDESFRVSLWQKSKETSLSPIQMQILIFLFFHESEKRKVSYLAKEFNLTKATVSEAIRTLHKKGFIRKETETQDSRSYIIHLTEKGTETAQKTSSFANILLKPLSDLSEKQKEVLLESLLELIKKLQEVNIIQVQRMCFSCRFYAHEEGHYCKLLSKPLNIQSLRIDCPEYEA